MENWDEIRTAYHVARLGTVSGAALALGVHHATVIRHVDALEKRLGVKLFQRHARGYTATEAGVDLLRVARTVDDQFNQLSGRIRGRGNEVNGELVVTTLAEFTRMLTPLITEFQQEHPALKVRLQTSARRYRLEYGEAHVAIRGGSEAPSEPDNVVQLLVPKTFGLFASDIYIARHGRPKTLSDLASHRFVGPDDPKSRAPFIVWLREQVPGAQMVFRSDDFRAQEDAVREGTGLGFLDRGEAARWPGMQEVFPSQADWQIKLWMVTHMDIHRSAKVQAFAGFLKARLDHRARA